MSVARTQMVDTQIRPADVTDYDVIQAFLTVPREAFVPKNIVSLAYAETEIAINEHRKMISSRGFAKMLQACQPRKGEDVLLVGLGLGYEAAVLSQLVDTVLAIEEDSALLKTAEQNLLQAEIDNVVAVKGKFAQGLPKSAPYDLIVFAGAVDEVPQSYFKQLKDGGRLIAFISRDGVHGAYTFHKAGDAIAENFEFHAFAPQILARSQPIEFEF